MTAPRNPDQLIRTYLIEDQATGQPEVPDHVYTAIRLRIEQTRQRAVIGPRGVPDMNKFVAVGLAAAAVVVIAVIAFNLLPGSPVPGGEPSATPEPSVAAPSAAAGLPEGPHLIVNGNEDPAATHPDLTVTIPGPGWHGDVGGGILGRGEDSVEPDNIGMIIFIQPEYIVYGDACHWETTVPETPATSVDEFVAALSSQGSREASEPVDITLDGYAGKAITLEVPGDFDFTECDANHSGSWDCGGDGTSPCAYHGGPNGIDTVYVLDIDGLIMAWETWYYTGTSAEDVAELEAIVQSASFGE